MKVSVNFMYDGVDIYVPHGIEKLHRHHAMYPERATCEPGLRALIKQLYESKVLDSSKNIIDLGAWIGDNSLPWAKSITGDVFAIDPSSFNIDFIKHMCHLNNIHNVKTIISCISDKDETVYSDGSLTHTQFHTNKSGVASKATSIDNLYRNEVIDNIEFIHLDVESFEYKVLCGSTNVINKFKPLIVWEHHLSESDTKTIIHMLDEMNYTTYMINESFPHCRPDCRNFISIQSTLKNSLLDIADIVNNNVHSIIKVSRECGLLLNV